ncbi:MAG TPA: hypothetical protein VK738_19385 [Terriglobales bacterium]|nr:hypothetical protein [Terriglobales bacterium]
MKIAQLFGVKTNPSQQPRCCHKRNDGTECNAHPRKGRQYCFLHDPESQKKSTAARRAGGVIRGYKAQEVLKLPPNLPALPLRDTADVVEMFRVTVNHFRQGEMDLRSANCIRNFGLAMLRGFEFEMRAQREATGKATRPAKKQPIEGLNLVFRDITGAQIYPRETAATSAPNPLSSHSQPDPNPKPDTARLDKREDKPEQGMQDSLSPASAACAQNQTKAQQQTEQNEPKPNDQNKSQQNGQNKPQPNGDSAVSPAPSSAQPVSPAPKEHQSVQYPPGLGPRYLALATPEMPWWRRPQYNNPGFVTGTVPKAAARSAARFRGTRR